MSLNSFTVEFSNSHLFTDAENKTDVHPFNSVFSDPSFQSSPLNFQTKLLIEAL